MPPDVRLPHPRRRLDIPPQSLQAGSGSTDGDSDAAFQRRENHSAGEFCKGLTSKEDFAKKVRRSMLDVQNDPRTIISFAQKPLLKYAACMKLLSD
jgi:hypothetical protein